QRFRFFDEIGKRDTYPGNHHRPSFYAAHTVDSLFQRRQLHDAVDVQGLRLLDHAFYADCPWPGAKTLGQSSRRVLIRAELVIVVVICDVFERGRSLRGAVLALYDSAQL